MGFPSSDPRYHKLTNKCNARVFYGGGGLHVPVGRGVDGEERLYLRKGGNARHTEMHEGICLAWKEVSVQ